VAVEGAAAAVAAAAAADLGAAVVVVVAAVAAVLAAIGIGAEKAAVAGNAGESAPPARPTLAGGTHHRQKADDGVAPG
jgi:hypothetical protein